MVGYTTVAIAEVEHGSAANCHCRRGFGKLRAGPSMLSRQGPVKGEEAMGITLSGGQGSPQAAGPSGSA